MTEKWSRSMWVLHVVVLTLVVVVAVEPTWGQEPVQSSTAKPRIEKDLLGEKEIPENAYYGVQTARAG